MACFDIPHIHVAIPAMDEADSLPEVLSCVAQQQTACPITVYICVNQPEKWWEEECQKEICLRNAATLRWLEHFRQTAPFPLVVMDKSSRSHGWQGKNEGVGWARKTLFNHILSIANPDDLVVSMDADTTFTPHYLDSVRSSMSTHPHWVALSVPYYHPLTKEVSANRAILRYELYMRNYLLNMLRIGSPYAFTALGSAIVVRASALKKIGGITPLKSGEDFYLLQKLRKMGPVGAWNSECVHPAARFSERVDFGTGPAMQKGCAGDWSSYPIYSSCIFDKIAETYQQLDMLYEKDIPTEFTLFLQQQFKTNDLWGPLRRNSRTLAQFRHAFHEKADGLRILQFLRQEQRRENTPDAQALCMNIRRILTKEESEDVLPLFCSGMDLDSFSDCALEQLRDSMFTAEMRLRTTIP